MKLAIYREEVKFLLFHHIGDGSLRLVVLLQVFAAANAAAKWESALFEVFIRRRVRHVEWAILAFAISDKFFSEWQRLQYHMRLPPQV